MAQWASRVWVILVLALGLATVWLEVPAIEITDPLRFSVYCLGAILTTIWRVHLPTVGNASSMNSLFLLLGVIELDLAETLVIALSAILARHLWGETKSSPKDTAFQGACVLIAVSAAFTVFHSGNLALLTFRGPLRLALAALVFFFMRSGAVAIAVCLRHRIQLTSAWRQRYSWAFASYLVEAGFAGVLSTSNSRFGWQWIILILPATFIVYRSYGMYLGKLAEEKEQAVTGRKQAEEMAALHLRTIEALALAIEAKDEVTSAHLRRMQIYSAAVGKELGLSEPELHALVAAAVLHDVGKLAVPEHILSKPGSLTPEEFEKMKIHPLVGAEILERVRFPYPVAPLVRHHHERWDGTGYPDGLAGEEIPLGSRILSAVDCLDALATDRVYRPSIHIDQAMEYLRSQAGIGFDPRVVDVLSRRYKILEVKVGRQAAVGTGAKPPANRARAANPPLDSSPLAPPDDALFVSSIAAARQEAQVLFELSRDLVTSLDLSGTLSATKARIQELIPHDSIALYSRSGKQLECEYAEGEGSPLFSTLLIPIGQGLSGWVATNNQAILNGNPAAEASYLNDARLHSTLRSALVIPLESETGVTGVLALYRTGTNAFTKDHLRILQIIAPRLTLALENIRRFRSAESTAGRDYLTDLPNARSLFHHLETSLERAAVAGEGLCVLVCDLDGFKAVNDRFGHLQGNDILRATAETFRSHSRKGDFISRMGGDEFVIVLPQTSRDEAARHASRLREALERRGFEILGEPMLSMSIGLAHYPSEGASAESLLAQADQLMYAEKAARSRQDRSVAGLAHAVHSRQ